MESLSYVSGAYAWYVEFTKKTSFALIEGAFFSIPRKKVILSKNVVPKFQFARAKNGGTQALSTPPL